MLDPRIKTLADGLIEYSCSLKRGETVLIEAIDVPHEMVIQLIRSARSKGGRVLVTLKSNTVLREIVKDATEAEIKQFAACELYRMKKVDAYIGIRGSHNVTEMSDVPGDKMQQYTRHWIQPVHIKERVNNTKWVVLRWPTPSMAQQAAMSTEVFEDFYFRVCTLDYSRMSKAMNPLKRLMERTDQVRIVGPGTDLRFSIRGIPVIKCDGKLNIPDGEIFTAPVRNSVEGTVHFNAETLYQGTVFSDITLTFRKGRIVEATGSDTDRINEILDTDRGARYVGEFALGVNPYITRPMKDILFDEKIMGSFHFTPGNAYDEADNGNKSSIHWDMVCIQTEEYGGGEIYFDGKLIREDGLFVPKSLQGLNPENLM